MRGSRTPYGLPGLVEQRAHGDEFSEVRADLKRCAPRGPGGDMVAVATLDDVRAAVEAVPDPEMPAVTVGDLGMVVDVVTYPARDGLVDVRVDLVATYSACPGVHGIRAATRQAASALPGVRHVDVRFVRSVAWSPERISATGRERLRAGGIAPPGLPVVAVAERSVACPRCGSERTRMDARAGSTPCRSVHACDDCGEAFEAIRP